MNIFLYKNETLNSKWANQKLTKNIEDIETISLFHILNFEVALYCPRLQTAHNKQEIYSK